MTSLNLESYRLRFRRPFTIARGTRDGTDTVIVTLRHGSLTGYGEASLPPYLGTDDAMVKKFLSSVDLHRFTLDDTGTFLENAASLGPRNMPALAALDMAVHDLAGLHAGEACPLAFGTGERVSVPTCYTLSMADASDLESALGSAADFGMLKVKAGGPGDRAWLDAVATRSGKPFCVDANQGWTDREQVLDLLHHLSETGAVFVEQPMPARQDEDMRWLKARSPLPLIADESLQDEGDLDRVQDCFHGINVKLMKCGGMRPAARIIREARVAGMKVLVGCMSESSCGVAAAAVLAPMADWADLDGPLLIANDPFEGIEYRNGLLCTSGEPGLGIKRKNIRG